MFRKRVFRLSPHVTTEGNMTSEQKRGESEKIAPLVKQSNKQSKRSFLVHTHGANQCKQQSKQWFSADCLGHTGTEIP